MGEHNTITHMEADKNSYEFGKAGNRFKLYFTTVNELKETLDALKAWGFPVEQAFEISTKKEVLSYEPSNESK